MTIDKIDRMKEEETLAITRAQAKKATYPDPRTEKERVRAAKADVEREIKEEQRETTNKATCTSDESKQNILRQVLQTEVSIKIKDLLSTMA